MFVQLNGWSWAGAGTPAAGREGARQRRSAVRFRTRSGSRGIGLTLMRMVTVGFLTVVIGHVG